MSKYQDRLDNLNDSEREVWDSIDRPIRPLIWELNRIGLQTKFCCCGFNYDGEEEPKTHAKQPFVVLRDPGRTADANKTLTPIRAFFNAVQIAFNQGWETTPYGGSGEWHMHFCPSDGSFYAQESRIAGVHDYETSLLRMQRLTEVLQMLPSVAEKFSIVDGNRGYAELTGGEWQVQPKKDSLFDSSVRPYKIRTTDAEKDN
jgi:hypothetical protein